MEYFLQFWKPLKVFQYTKKVLNYHVPTKYQFICYLKLTKFWKDLCITDLTTFYRKGNQIFTPIWFRQKYSTTHVLIHLTDKIRYEIKVTMLLEYLQNFKRHLIQQITIYYWKNKNTMVSEEFQINGLLHILVTRSGLFQLMVTKQISVMTNVGYLKVPYRHLLCSLFTLIIYM